MMNAISNLLSTHGADALGWTLLYSIWQSFVILVIVLGCLRFIPPAFARIRYTVSCTGFFLTIISSVITFISFTDPAPFSVSVITAESIGSLSPLQQQGSVTILEQALTTCGNVIETNMSLIITAWMMGFLIFSMRLLSGVIYTRNLQTAASPLHNAWAQYIQKLADTLGITRLITLAESPGITTPMVIGYFKPVVLVPVGMLTGLTTEQLETIFMHEVAHIKRHDFLVNLLQSVVEAIFFFNPFIWILSGRIRQEREYCCDDMVVAQHGSALAYARALAELEEVRLSKHMFALSLAENKNQLLYRIKRIMEKSAKNYSEKNRMLVPAMVLIAGLFCISWLSLDQKNPDQREDNLDPMTDSLPHPGPGLRQRKEWEEFSRAFEEKFRKRFEDFYSSHETDLSKMMEELQEKFESKDWQSAMSFENFPTDEMFQEAERAREQAFQRLKEFDGNEVFKDLEQNMKQLQEMDLHLPDIDVDINIDHNSFRQYEQALREQLIKDGYLSADEPINSMEWSDEAYKINGKPIKDSDKNKYDDLREKYLENRPKGKVE